MTIDEKAPVVEAVLTYLYNFNYETGMLITSRPPPMVFHAQVYAMAEMYGIQSLKTYSKEKFETTIATGWNLEAFPSSITEVFSTTPETDRGLRDPVIKVCCENSKALVADDGFKVILREAPGFAAEFAEVLAGGDTVVVKECLLTVYECPDCGREWHGNLNENPDLPSSLCPYCQIEYDNEDWARYTRRNKKR